MADGTLQQRVELLEEHVRWIRQAMAPAHRRSWRGLRLTRGDWIILNALAAGAPCSFASLQDLTEVAQLREASCSASAIRVRIWRIRSQLGALLPPIAILNVRGVGYRIDGASVEALAAREIAA